MINVNVRNHCLNRTETTANGQKHKKLFFLAPECARTVLNAFLECMCFDKMTVIYAYTDVAYMD